MPWIEINDLHLMRGGRPVLNSISASLAGQAVGLVGPNGAGKSTLIGALLGVLPADRGRVRVLECEIPRDAMEIRTRSGVMAEQAGVFPGGSGVDAVTFAGTLTGLSRREALRRAHRALDALDVGEERYRPARTYSTGMRQRCKLGMCLVHNPEILILDEPTVGLDPLGRIQLLTLIRDLRDEGKRILLSTHILQDAEFLCDDLLLLEAGSVSYFGPVTELVGGEHSVLIVEGDGVGGAFIQALTNAGITVKPDGDTRVHVEPRNDDDLRLFWRVAADAGVEVRHLGRDVPTLEDAVVTAMEHGNER